jgi:quercetin dioxygenase-like cupin family protein
VLEGTATIDIEGETRQASRDTLVPSAAGGLHAIRNDTDDMVRFLVVKTPNPNG